MEYTLSLNLSVLNEWVGEIDATDAILAGIVASWSRKRRGLVQDTEGRVWISHQFLAREFPILGKNLSLRTLRARLARLEEIGLIETKRVPLPYDKGGSQVFYGMSESYKAAEERWRFICGAMKDYKAGRSSKASVEDFINTLGPVEKFRGRRPKDKRPRNERGQFAKVAD
jgi:hypothetical protein